MLLCVGTTTMLSEGGYKAYKPDEPAAQLQQLNLYHSTQSTTGDKEHQSTGKMQLIDKQKSIADEKVEELEKVFAEIQNLKNQVSLTQQQLSEVQKDNAYLKNQLSLTQQQLLGVQSMLNKNT